MKKVIYIIAMTFAGTGISMANPVKNHSGEGTDSAKVEEAAAANAEATFVTAYENTTKQLTVNVAGIVDPYASVSVTNQRGTTIQCSLIQEKSGEYSFDLSKLQKGTYNVMLITEQEIRIKRIQVG